MTAGNTHSEILNPVSMSGRRPPVYDQGSSHLSLQEPRAGSEARSTSPEAKAQKPSHLTTPSIKFTLDYDDLDRR